MDGVFKYINLSKADRKNSEPFLKIKRKVSPDGKRELILSLSFPVGYKKRRRRVGFTKKKFK